MLNWMLILKTLHQRIQQNLEKRWNQLKILIIENVSEVTVIMVPYQYSLEYSRVPASKDLLTFLMRSCHTPNEIPKQIKAHIFMVM